jgi:hypothetical protein
MSENDCQHKTLQHTNVGGVCCPTCGRKWTLVEFIGWTQALRVLVDELALSPGRYGKGEHG